ncbi:hypothetical protein [Helicobacter sp. T3_23-1056]
MQKKIQHKANHTHIGLQNKKPNMIKGIIISVLCAFGMVFAVCFLMWDSYVDTLNKQGNLEIQLKQAQAVLDYQREQSEELLERRNQRIEYLENELKTYRKKNVNMQILVIDNNKENPHLPQVQQISPPTPQVPQSPTQNP